MEVYGIGLSENNRHFGKKIKLFERFYQMLKKKIVMTFLSLMRDINTIWNICIYTIYIQLMNKQQKFSVSNLCQLSLINTHIYLWTITISGIYICASRIVVRSFGSI